MKRMLWLVVTLLAACSTVLGQQDAAVAKFYPQALRDLAGDDLDESVSYAGVQYGSEQFIVAAYTNGVSVITRVLKVTAAGAELVCDPPMPRLVGVRVKVAKCDVDHDGVPEIALYLGSPGGNSTLWLLRWTGACLESFGPTVDDGSGSLASLVGDPEFVDINSDRIDELVDIRPYEVENADGTLETVQRPTLYALVNGTYEPTKNLDFYEMYVRQTAKPYKVHEQFTTIDDAHQATVIVLNGDDGDHLVDSAVISLNNVVIVDSNEFKSKPRRLTISGIQLGKTNELTVELKSAPKSRLRVLIEPE